MWFLEYTTNSRSFARISMGYCILVLGCRGRCHHAVLVKQVLLRGFYMYSTRQTKRRTTATNWCKMANGC